MIVLVSQEIYAIYLQVFIWFRFLFLITVRALTT